MRCNLELSGEDLATAYVEACRADFAAMERRRYLESWRAELRRLLAYLAIRWDNAWLACSAEVLEGYLPDRWRSMPLHELMDWLWLTCITPEHCTLA